MTFSTGHILLTAALVAVLTAVVGRWRISANKPRLDDDGPPTFSLAFVIALAVNVTTI